MTPQTDTLYHCRRCRWSVVHQAADLDPLLWCQLREATCKAACPWYERYPGCEGDDD